jgi:hypothetical protein
MSREIKFRAVMPERNATVYFTLKDLIDPQPLFSTRELVIPWLRKGNKPDLYISHKDINNVEIYEGDIVRGTGSAAKNIIGIVSWQVPYTRFSVVETQSNLASFLMASDWKSAEVIGNIYESPELYQPQGYMEEIESSEKPEKGKEN